MTKFDPVTHPKHYNSHPSGVECADITVHMPTMIGCAMKYLWRWDLKGDPIENLRKAIWCVERHIRMLEEEADKQVVERHTVSESGQPRVRDVDVCTDHPDANWRHCEGCHSVLCEQTAHCFAELRDPS